ncbi:MAG: ATP-dependent helicase [Planctomycetaceae bacterium]|nr:ATP-dependent helicase [Planctomycetaceae bacterium]
MIPLTDEQQAAVDYQDNLCLTSCPGSGKTRTIIVKLHRCIEEVRGTPRRIACITYTNAGVHEIEARLRLYGSSGDGDLCEVSTIHAFCLNYVLRPFAHLIPHLQGEWSVATSDDPWFSSLVTRLSKKYQIKASLADMFDGLSRTFPNGKPSKSEIPLAAVLEFFQTADADGKVTLGDIVYFASKLVQEHDFIASGLASRFAWFVVDEFQDTTLSQAIMLLRIQQQGRSKFFIVGDPNQSILSFAGAKPKLMAQFADRVNAKVDCQLTGNFRSSKLILDIAELLCPSNPRMVAMGENHAFHVAPRYQHCKTTIEGVFDHFLPAIDALKIEIGETAILAPWWMDLMKVGKLLRDRRIPIIGPGSRPYRRSHEFATLSEALAAYMANGDAENAAIVQKTLFVTLANIADIAPWMIFRYDGRRIVFRLIGEAHRVFKVHESAVEWLRETAAACEAILIEEELLTSKHAGIFTRSAAAMISEMTKNDPDVANMAAVDLGMVASPKNCMSLLTMHKAKGREFDAVAVINLHDDRVPNFNYKTKEDEDEYRRLLYVAVTRARKLLMLFTDQGDHRNQPSRFLRRPYLGMC